MRCRGGGDAMAPKKVTTVKKHILKEDDPDFCKVLVDPFVVDLKECNYSTKTCKAGRALVQWNVELQKPVGNLAGVNGYVNVLKTYEGGPPLGATRFHVCNQTPCPAMHTQVSKFGIKGPSFHGFFSFGSQKHFESPPPPPASVEAGLPVPVEESPSNDDLGPSGEGQALTPKKEALTRQIYPAMGKRQKRKC